MSVRHGRRSGYPQVTMDDIRVGSIVHIKSREWYDENKDPDRAIRCGRALFIPTMKYLLDQDVTVEKLFFEMVSDRIQPVSFKTTHSGYLITPEMVEYVVKY